jgi:hypothetical protein
MRLKIEEMKVGIFIFYGLLFLQGLNSICRLSFLHVSRILQEERIGSGYRKALNFLFMFAIGNCF